VKLRGRRNGVIGCGCQTYTQLSKEVTGEGVRKERVKGGRHIRRYLAGANFIFGGTTRAVIKETSVNRHAETRVASRRSIASRSMEGIRRGQKIPMVSNVSRSLRSQEKSGMEKATRMLLASQDEHERVAACSTFR